ncbi:RagB/SusD family nutrient uptake outer membrane protein [Olivibacter sitiensis]|uniref:RagB/SusD family nutrient uptake outer membrane protein n=1 Tax=Olivibacter sitiensis TaxID=376470 RepID=UPI000567628B|nr:RagB/SusD family nutrient uptake outer membrane protein [Olivibacter sitiensis]
MKKITIMGLGLLALVSCDSILDVEPVSQISVNQAFSNLNSAEGVVNGMYNNLQTPYMWRMQVITDVASDMSQQTDSWDALIAADQFDWSVDNSEVEDLYTSIYRCIDIANNVIVNVPQMDIAQANKDDMMGQAYWIRGLAYFDLARLFGGYPNVYGNLGVVIVLQPSIGISDEDLRPRSSLAETYAQVESDLLQALQLLPENRSSSALSKAKATKPAARALLARYYLYNQQWAQAEQYATDAIAGKGLNVPFASIFTTDNSEESLFELQFNNTDGMGLRNWYFPSTLGGRGGTALHAATYEVVISDPEDVRSQFLAQHPVNRTYYVTKWSDAQNANNFQLLRLAEQYLIRAEARAEQGNLTGALADLNAVRTRAGVQPSNASGAGQIVEAILNERRLEFVGEGQRWFDVIRKGLGMQVFQNIVRTTGSQPSYSLPNAGRQVMPIPSVEINANPNMEQNEAYR